MKYALIGMLVDPGNVNLLVACLNFAGTVGLTVGMFALRKRRDWREGVDRKMALLFNKFRALKDRYSLDTSIEDD